MSNTMGMGQAMGTPHKPTLKWVFVGIIVLFVAYHFGLGKGRK
jgi:hypothetical protein